VGEVKKMGYQKKDKRAWVSASKAGRAEFCPHYLELEGKRATVSKKAVAARINGDAKHNSLNRKAEDKRCFVASHLYGIDDNRTELLRTFRDNRLKSSLPGQLFIAVYYRLSPLLVTLAKRYPLIDIPMGLAINKIVKRLQKKQSNG
jgi:hypothetical protein